MINRPPNGDVCLISLLPFCSAAQPRRTLADLIMDKITEKKTEIESQMSDATQNLK
jgi:hypothetical protein